MKSGIYKIHNKINNKCYIGSSSNLLKRKKQHFNSLNKNKHYNDYLQRSYNKYQKESFEFIIFCFCLEHELIEMEQYYIDKYNPEYNVAPIAGKTTGYKFTKEQKLQQGINRSIPIIRIDLYTHKIIDEWKSAKFASVELKLGKPTAITACCKNQIPSAYGYYWQYKSNSTNYIVPIVKRCQPKNKELITQALELYKSGKTISEISKTVGLSYHTLYYNLK